MSKYFFCIALAALCGCELKASGDATIKGNYAFLSDFTPMPEEEARNRIREMVHTFGIKEFQFYDWFADYSTPTVGRSWKDPFFQTREISLDTLEIYIDEIHKLGGRAWAYVQAAGAQSETLDVAYPGVVRERDGKGDPYRHAGKIPVYRLNASLAVYQVQVWADAVKTLGFDGIHWDTLGSLAADKIDEAEGVYTFLRAARELLGDKGLLQTLNFVDLAWWDFKEVGSLVHFPYAELWSNKTQTYVAKMEESRSHGVLLSYAAYVNKKKESQFSEILQRAAFAKTNGHFFILVADGAFRLETEYIPARVPMTNSEIHEVARLGH